MNKKIKWGEGHLQRGSHHINCSVRIKVYLNHLKWNEGLMKTVEPNVVAGFSTNQRTFINEGFQFLWSKSKVLECFPERRMWDITSTINFCDSIFQFPARRTMMCYHFLIFSSFFHLFKKQFSLQLEPWVLGQQNKSFCFEIWQKHQLVL